MEDFFTEYFQGIDPVNEYMWVPTGMSGNTNTTGNTVPNDTEIFGEDAGTLFGCPYDDQTLAYCLLDGRIYLGEQAAWEAFQTGDMTPLMILAHEWGHRSQHSTLMPGAEAPFQQTAKENQADCIAGVFLDWLHAEGHYAEKGDDSADLVNGLIWVASFTEEHPFEEQDHGNTDQRLRAFFTGYLGNAVMACNVYLANWDIAEPIPEEESTTSEVPLRSVSAR
jgi:hypothetical protein